MVSLGLNWLGGFFVGRQGLEPCMGLDPVGLNAVTILISASTVPPLPSLLCKAFYIRFVHVFKLIVTDSEPHETFVRHTVGTVCFIIRIGQALAKILRTERAFLRGYE